jgi:(p)ppGpp synthase/HD superfamily hydrolase
MKTTTTAIPLEKLLEQLPDTYTVADRELVQRAYIVAEEAHREQKRHSGEPYINHCMAVASILAELKVPSEVIAAGLLHDTVEDTPVTLADIRRDFGDTVKILVDGVTKFTHCRESREATSMLKTEPTGAKPEEVQIEPALLGRKEDMISETLRKTFLAMGEDVRVCSSSWQTVCITCARLVTCPSINVNALRRKPSIFLPRSQTDSASGKSSGNWKTLAFAMCNPGKI